MANETQKVEPGWVRFLWAVFGLLLILAGALGIIIGSNLENDPDFADWPVSLSIPGLVVIGLGFVAMWKGGRPRKGPYHDPDSHLVLPRDVHDQLESMDREDIWDDDDDR